MAMHKLLESCFALSMKALEFMHSRGLLYIQFSGAHNIWLPLQEVLNLIRGDMGHHSEDMNTVVCCMFHAVLMLDLPLTCFFVYIEILQVVIEVHSTSTQVVLQQHGMSSEDVCHRKHQAPGTAQTQTNACQPFLKVGNHI